jgi:hypothetical protein
VTYRVTFETDDNGDCWWNVEASSPEEARAKAIEWFRDHPDWGRKYAETPPSFVEVVGDPSHGDSGV